MATSTSLRSIFLFAFLIACAAFPAAYGGTWCIATTSASPAKLQSNINFACKVRGVDCRAIQPGGSCFYPNTVQNHASYAMNAYYQHSGRHSYDCYFGGTGTIAISDPSWGSCRYPGRR